MKHPVRYSIGSHDLLLLLWNQAKKYNDFASDGKTATLQVMPLSNEGLKVFSSLLSEIMEEAGAANRSFGFNRIAHDSVRFSVIHDSNRSGVAIERAMCGKSGPLLATLSGVVTT